MSAAVGAHRLGARHDPVNGPLVDVTCFNASIESQPPCLRGRETSCCCFRQHNNELVDGLVRRDRWVDGIPICARGAQATTVARDHQRRRSIPHPTGGCGEAGRDHRRPRGSLGHRRPRRLGRSLIPRAGRRPLGARAGRRSESAHPRQPHRQRTLPGRATASDRRLRALLAADRVRVSGRRRRRAQLGRGWIEYRRQRWRLRAKPG